MRLAIFLGFALCFAGVSAQARDGTADRLYVLECGAAHADDQSLWSPGVRVGLGLDMSDNCYLIRHKDEWLLWDTGIADNVADHPEGVRNEVTRTTWKRKQKLIDQLAGLGLQPTDIRWLAVSHFHSDHSGNVEALPQVTLLVQAAEYEGKLQDGSPRFAPTHPVRKLDGDFDVFGDRSVMILSTPGHTEGHQSLLVRLRKTGAVLLSGDAVHFADNWMARRVPRFNLDASATRQSLEKIERTLASERAQLWINHDAAQSAGQKHAPAYYD